MRERLNYGLALLRVGEMARGIAELEKVQKQDPKLPHTWFNLGVAYKRESEFDKALVEFQEMARLVPTEPVTHYQIGTLLKMKGETADAIKQFEAARNLNPLLAAPHFQLYGLYRHLKLQGDVLRDKLRVQLRLVHLDDVDEDIAAGALAKLRLELVDLRAFAADYNPRPGGADEKAQLVARPLDLDRADARGLQLFAQLRLQLHILDQELVIVAL